MWIDIEGSPGYQVSDAGEVRSLDRTVVKSTGPVHYTGRTLKPGRFSNGYLFVHCGRRSKAHLIHRLVAAAFIPGDSALQVNHKNGSRHDNRVENLEWVTCSQNHQHSYDNLSRKQHSKTAPVALAKGEEILIFESELAAAQHLGVVHGSIYSAATRSHKCKGYEVYHV